MGYQLIPWRGHKATVPPLPTQIPQPYPPLYLAPATNALSSAGVWGLASSVEALVIRLRMNLAVPT